LGPFIGSLVVCQVWIKVDEGQLSNLPNTRTVLKSLLGIRGSEALTLADARALQATGP
jgi:hypothetical protein